MCPNVATRDVAFHRQRLWRLGQLASEFDAGRPSLHAALWSAEKVGKVNSAHGQVQDRPTR